jgi:hypothetical protein
MRACYLFRVETEKKNKEAWLCCWKDNTVNGTWLHWWFRKALQLQLSVWKRSNPLILDFKLSPYSVCRV